MQYMLLIYAGGEDVREGTPAGLAPADALPDWVSCTRALRREGVLVAGEVLRAVQTATTVRVRAGERLLVDGPFAETKEWLLGFYLVELPDLDAALRWASRMPDGAHLSVEVRPVQPSQASAQVVLG